MTIKEFKARRWESGMYATHRLYPGRYAVASVDFDEQTIGLKDFGEKDSDEIHWARCENVELLEGGER